MTAIEITIENTWMSIETSIEMTIPVTVITTRIAMTGLDKSPARDAMRAYSRNKYLIIQIYIIII